MSDILNFNGTIEGLGGPLIGWTKFTRVLFLYYRRGTKYSEPIPGKTEKGVQQYKTIEVNSVDKIKESTPISKIEVRYIRENQNVSTNADGSLNTNPKKMDNFLNSISWLPIGLANTFTQFADNTIQNILGDYWNMVPFTLKPILVRNSSKSVSTMVTSSKRVLDDNDDSLIKETSYSNVSKRSDTLSIELFSTVSNLMLELLLGYLETWMDSQKSNQNYDSMTMDDSAIAFPEYVGYPDEKSLWDKSNSKYFIKRLYLPEASPSYMFSYISDSVFFRRGKLSGYSVNPARSGDGVTVTINFEKVVSEEEAFIYQKQKTNQRKDVSNTSATGDLNTLASRPDSVTTNIGGQCKITNVTTNSVSSPFQKAIDLLGRGKTTPNYTPIP